jgi:hypothetical protein
MPEPTMPAGDLGDELRRYFAATTSTALPRRVTDMSARTLAAGRNRVGGRLAAFAGGLAAVALLVLGVTQFVPHGGGADSALSSAGAGIAELAPASRVPVEPDSIAYRGLDAVALAARGVRLLLPAGHGTPLVTEAQAQEAARAGAGGLAGSPGPAVLTFADLTDRSEPLSCLCWVVDVPVANGPGEGSSGTSAMGTELVLVDAVSGRIVDVLSGYGIP